MITCSASPRGPGRARPAAGRTRRRRPGARGARARGRGALARRRRRARRDVEDRSPAPRAASSICQASSRRRRAIELARAVRKDPRAVELILRESTAVSRQAPGVLVVRHRLGFVVANAGIDSEQRRALRCARRAAARGRCSCPRHRTPRPPPSARGSRPRRVRAWGSSSPTRSDGRSGWARWAWPSASRGCRPLWDRRGEPDLFGRALENTITALADQVAAVADLVAGQAAERRPVVLVRGLGFRASDQGASALVRRAEEDLYA